MNHTHMQLSSQVFNHLHLAWAMVSELGLDKEANAWSKTSPGAINKLEHDRNAGGERTLDERRAMLGLFCLNSMYVVLASHA